MHVYIVKKPVHSYIACTCQEVIDNGKHVLDSEQCLTLI